MIQGVQGSEAMSVCSPKIEVKFHGVLFMGYIAGHKIVTAYSLYEIA